MKIFFGVRWWTHRRQWKQNLDGRPSEDIVAPGSLDTVSLGLPVHGLFCRRCACWHRRFYWHRCTSKVCPLLPGVCQLLNVRFQCDWTRTSGSVCARGWTGNVLVCRPCPLFCANLLCCNVHASVNKDGEKGKALTRPPLAFLKNLFVEQRRSCRVRCQPQQR